MHLFENLYNLSYSFTCRFNSKVFFVENLCVIPCIIEESMVDLGSWGGLRFSIGKIASLFTPGGAPAFTVQPAEEEEEEEMEGEGGSLNFILLRNHRGGTLSFPSRRCNTGTTRYFQISLFGDVMRLYFCPAMVDAAPLEESCIFLLLTWTILGPPTILLLYSHYTPTMLPLYSYYTGASQSLPE